jgi:hypothetical protein
VPPCPSHKRIKSSWVLCFRNHVALNRLKTWGTALLDAHAVENWIEDSVSNIAYEALVSRGELIINLQPLGLGDRQITGYALRTNPRLDVIINPVHKVSRIDSMSGSEFKTYNDKLDRDAGRIERTPRALADMERMFAGWLDANPGYGIFENQSREQVKQLIFAYLDDEEIPYSTSAVANAAEYLHAQGKLFRESDVRSGQSGEFNYRGTRLVIHPQKGIQS